MFSNARLYLCGQVAEINLTTMHYTYIVMPYPPNHAIRTNSPKDSSRDIKAMRTDFAILDLDQAALIRIPRIIEHDIK